MGGASGPEHREVLPCPEVTRGHAETAPLRRVAWPVASLPSQARRSAATLHPRLTTAATTCSGSMLAAHGAAQGGNPPLLPRPRSELRGGCALGREPCSPRASTTWLSATRTGFCGAPSRTGKGGLSGSSCTGTDSNSGRSPASTLRHDCSGSPDSRALHQRDGSTRRPRQTNRESPRRARRGWVCPAAGGRLPRSWQALPHRCRRLVRFLSSPRSQRSHRRAVGANSSPCPSGTPPPRRTRTGVTGCPTLETRARAMP
jgi:hypothetical protein